MKRMVRIVPVSWVALALLFASRPVFAGDLGHRVTGLMPTYRQECGACHVPYPPGLLPAESWRRLLSRLPRHYGTDASLDPATVEELSGWLDANAGTYKRVREAPPEDRITRSAWFRRKHDEVPAAVWQRLSVSRAANCGACHAQAAQGDFNEQSVRIPR